MSTATHNQTYRRASRLLGHDNQTYRESMRSEYVVGASCGRLRSADEIEIFEPYRQSHYQHMGNATAYVASAAAVSPKGMSVLSAKKACLCYPLSSVVVMQPHYYNRRYCALQCNVSCKLVIVLKIIHCECGVSFQVNDRSLTTHSHTNMSSSRGSSAA